MSNMSQRRAIDRYRERLAERGIARFEVLGRKSVIPPRPVEAGRKVDL